MRLFLYFLVVFPLFTSTAQALEIKDVRFGVHPDKTRMVVELDQKTDFKSFVLPKEADKPYRLVVDFPDFEWNAGTITQPPKIYVSDIRTGDLVNGVRRMVIDLQKPPLVTSAFILDAKDGKPHRLVIDFKQVSAEVFKSSKRKSFGTLEPQKKQTTKTGQPRTAQKKTSQNKASNDPLENLIQTFENEDSPVNITALNIPVPSKKPTLKQTAKPTTPLRKKIIVIDAGHGGNDPGAVGSGNLKEKNITLAAARELKKQLQKTGRFQVYLTRDNDRYIKLYKRVAIARARKADLFISLHADSIDKSNVRGASIYTLSNKSSDAQTAKLAARENQSDLIAGIDLSHEDKEVANILLDLAMRDTMNQSKFFANTVVDQKRAHGIRILERPHRFAGFAVLKAPDVPSVLVEMGFMSNKSEARLLNTPKHRAKIAASLVSAIQLYFTKVEENTLN